MSHIRNTLDADTGEIIRELHRDPTRDNQPLGRSPGPPKAPPNAADGRKVATHSSTMSRDFTKGAPGGIRTPNRPVRRMRPETCRDVRVLC